MVIGITGQIGSGKSTAARILESFGAAIIDADRIGRKVVEDNPELLARLVKTFGDDILGRTGKLNRKKLASVAFESESARQKLNGLVHPYLLKELKRQMKSLRSGNELVVIDAALLLEWNLDRILDSVILIHASENDRLDRLEQRGISRKDALARQRQQMPYTEQRQRADYVIRNNRSEDKLREKLMRVLLNLRRKTVDL